MPKRKTGKCARFAIRLEAAELRGWRAAAKSDRVSVGKMVRNEMGEVVARHRRVGEAMGLGGKTRGGGREPRGGMVKVKKGV